VPTEFVRMTHPDIADPAVVPLEAVDQYEARGWVRVSAATADLTRFATPDGYGPVTGGWEPVPDYVPVDQPVDTVLAQVGGDPAKAEAVLTEEQAQDKPRKSLTKKLEQVAEQTTTPEENGNG
jgi:hypothetical protein